MKTIPTVHELRKAGYKVKLSHHRRFFKHDAFSGKRHSVTVPFSMKEEHFKDYFLDPMGGETHISIFKEGSGDSYNAVAYCSASDHFCRKDGLKKAIARALHGNQLL